jgi:NAD+ synthase (glutamine-hydrolysing)
MKDGFICVACGTPKLRLADCDYNAEQTFAMMRRAEEAGVKVLVLPELGLTGYTCGDLFYQDALVRGAEAGPFHRAGRHPESGGGHGGGPAGAIPKQIV